ncbi:UDP-Glycosyltransferase/glycogen phosphorylase [Fomitiporia mediterranea MF3/22]|uniref:UDP-Glycosyltransferase/glycogen phosphorylase n=1 Tax=Fomitiporia mediterranea (strain MF3/22) TaxID=694068 RepID=R7SGE3_FOMME|nr:UDP-Glycosyltransferase/glycogen phosphorylase [Fomitiporia mediterranea MF3/22]EJC97776.1 UDP-Glycosyltransferase/glycogen phosphorylase [Fomitiporia mediterranea MF3/22]
MTIESRSIRGHVVVGVLPAWGHAKSSCALLSTLVRYRPVLGTIIIASFLTEKIERELDAQFLPEVEDDLRRLIRVVGVEIGPNLFDTTMYNANFMKEYEKLLNGKHAETESGYAVDTVEPGPPQLVILDFFLYSTLKSIRVVHSVPIYALQSGLASAMLFKFGPEGAHTHLAEEIEAIPYTDEDAIAEEADRLNQRSTGRVIKVPGLPPMYDHERTTQFATLPKGVGFIESVAHKFLQECDGAIMNTNRIYEAAGIKAFEDWFTGRPVISTGPFESPLIPRHEVEQNSNLEAMAFLDSALQKYGPNSVVYMSFGSAFWPSEVEKTRAIIDLMIKERVPFIFAHASPFSAMPEDMTEKIKASGFGYSSNWVPQRAILDHKACGWFITHCGHNSIFEALSAGVPLICWPFAADQPLAAAMIVEEHNVGYELFEVRTGDGLLPIHRLGDKVPEGTVDSVKREFSETLQKMRGQDGAEKRANTQKFRDEFAKLWAPGGENWDAIKRVADIIQ